ncbi:MAG: tRNA lysidine(34) synthetase TilS [Paludibacteraceae bacterium]
MLRRVQTYIKDKQLLRKGDRVLVCVSGGADSVALLDVLLRTGYTCIVAHCNFHLRGEESMEDERFVRRLCASLWSQSIPLVVSDFDTTAYAKSHKLSIEMAARELRYTWFAQVAEEQDCAAIAVAHHQNDQAETVLLNLFRGTGLRGLCGMRPKSSNPYGSRTNIPVIRPLLCTTRDYIEYYLRDRRKLTWRTDSTNSDTSIARNAIRALLAQHTKAEVENIAKTACRMQGYADWLDEQDTREAGIAKLYEQLRIYNFPEIEKIYDALQRGEGGKTFYAPHHVGIIKHGQLHVTPIK